MDENIAVLSARDETAQAILCMRYGYSPCCYIYYAMLPTNASTIQTSNFLQVESSCPHLEGIIYSSLKKNIVYKAEWH